MTEKVDFKDALATHVSSRSENLVAKSWSIGNTHIIKNGTLLSLQQFKMIDLTTRKQYNGEILH